MADCIVQNVGQNKGAKGKGRTVSAETETLSQLVSQFRTVGSAEPEEQRLSA